MNAISGGGFHGYALLALFALVVVGLERAEVEVGDEVSRDYCLSDVFEAGCDGADHLLLMRSARYGRMHLGTCLRTDYGAIDCSVDVIGVVDRRCSGRRNCRLTVPDPLFEELHNLRCQTELKSFLGAAYSCVTVATAFSPQCRTSRHIRLTAPTGYIPSLVTEETGGVCGSETVPWLVDAEQGKKIVFTLYDFGLADHHPRGGSDAPAPHLCLHYADVVERGSGQVHKVCGGRQRIAEVYASEASSVEVRMVHRKSPDSRGSWHRAKNSEQDSNTYFFIHYETFGCADPALTPSMWVKRSGDSATVGCAFNDLRWKLKCSGNEWIGSKGNCSQEALSSGSPDGATSGYLFSLPFEMSLAIIVGLAFVVGVTVFTIGIILLKRGAFRDRALEVQRMTLTDRSVDSGSLSVRTTVTSPSKHGQQTFLDPDRPSVPGQESDYAYVWDDVPDFRVDPSLHYLHPKCQVNATRLPPEDVY